LVGLLVGSESDREAMQPALDELDSRGFDPELVDDDVVLHNCPFHQLAQSHTELICGMNLALLDSMLGELDNTGWCARLQPHDGYCCVRLQHS